MIFKVIIIYFIPFTGRILGINPLLNLQIQDTHFHFGDAAAQTGKSPVNYTRIFNPATANPLQLAGRHNNVTTTSARFRPRFSYSRSFIQKHLGIDSRVVM
jgi:hypothetical protein